MVLHSAKESKGLEQEEGDGHNFIFWVNYPFKAAGLRVGWAILGHF